MGSAISEVIDKDHYDLRIDLIKGLAILGVVWQHALQWPQFVALGGPILVRPDVAVFMVIAGINSFRSYERRGVRSLAEGYAWPTISSSLLRLLPAYLIVWVLQVALVGGETSGSPGDYLVALVTGGWDWGAYFVPVIVGHVLLFPLLYWLILRLPLALLPVALAVDLGFELLANLWRLPNVAYEPVYLRYLFAVALGVWLARSKPAGLWVWVMAALSAVYIYRLDYDHVVTPLNWSWASRAAPAQPLALAYVAAGFFVLPQGTASRLWQGLAEAGRASYHIFLVQGIFFWRFYVSWPGSWQYLQALLIIVLVASLGWVFYRVEVAVRAALGARVQRRSKQAPASIHSAARHREPRQYYSSLPATRKRASSGVDRQGPLKDEGRDERV